MKKTLSLKDAMLSLHVIETDEGIELQSAAGTAKYDAWGARREVNGIPEYFPSSVTVNKRQPAPVGDKAPSVTDESCAPLVRTMKLRVELDTSDAQKAIDDLDDKIRNSDAFKDLKDGWSHEKNGTMIINHGQVFIRDAMIQDSSITKAKIGSEIASNNGSVSTTYVMKMGVERGTDENVEAILKNALKNAAQSAAHDGAKRAAEDLKSKTKDIQLAMLYNGEHFAGFGVAVDGQLLSDQCDAKVLQTVGDLNPAELQVTFRLKEKSTGKPIRIDLAELRNSSGW
ncbi:hypothetical protein ICQ41_004239 [Salmonella enterica]|nr:hypothetical protein [Salmonella enterica]EBF2684934.1 hypothetical protein [Salmonella enterica subsp. enterica serovar Senftenberg]ECM4408548.1 hypothetical protein [Salmonella enterica subsp. enterica serovar Give]EDL5017384.1 hypothetical protein [Salmonella enterica subsp. enterica serovar Poona]EDR2558297.1 hypothetical protein [Salmonella enterica subsp. enterica]EJR1452998.1 hypothetical protein [Salmonella enterica subsp. enterica serovar Muenster]HCZ3806089.1 hypothetical protein